MSNEQERRLAVSKVKHKVFAYITHGHRLLVFRHPDAPEAEVRLGFLQKSIISSLWQILQRSLLSLQLGCPEHPKNRGVPL